MGRAKLQSQSLDVTLLDWPNAARLMEPCYLVAFCSEPDIFLFNSQP